MGRSLSVSEARPREERPAGFRPSAGPGGGGFGGPRPAGGGFGGPRPGGPAGGFGGPRPGGFRSGPGGASAPAAPGGRNFGPPKKKATAADKRWESKDRGPRGPIKERYTGRLGGLEDDPNDRVEPVEDFDDVASRAPDEEDGEK